MDVKQVTISDPKVGNVVEGQTFGSGVVVDRWKNQLNVPTIRVCYIKGEGCKTCFVECPLREITHS